jgi:tetratricopeptide (TPR) repeat protein
MVKGPRYSDPADGIQLLRVAAWFGPACYGMLSMLWYFLFHKGWISGGVFALLLVLNLPLTVLGILVIHRVVGSAAVGLVHTIFAVGDVPLEPTYPRQDVLIARGQYAEAAEWFRDHIRIEPDDHEARLRLAQLLESHLQGYDEAERLYLEIRKAQPPATPREQMRAANGLIDVYRKLGRTDRLKVELARFVDRYRGTPFADGAIRELQQLKEAELTSGSRHSPT